MRALALGGLFVLLWASAFPAAKLVVAEWSPLWALVIRFIPSTLILAAIVAARGLAWPARGDRPRVVWMGAMGVAAYLACAWIATSMIPSGLITLLTAAAPLFVALGERFWLKRHLPAQAWAGLLLGWAGVALLGGFRALESQGSAELTGILFGILGAACQALGILVFAPARGRVDPWAANALQSGVATLVLLPLALLVEGGPPGALSLAGLAGLFWSIVMVGVVLYGLLFVMLRLLPPATAAALQLLAPPIAAALGWAMLGERLGWADLAGGVLTLAGLALLIKARR